MAQFISDKEMQELEKAGHAKSVPPSTPLMHFISDADMAKMEQQNQVPQAETAVRNLAQGATLGFSDELAGAGEALGRAVGLEGAGGPMRDIHMAEGGPTLNLDTLKKAYLAGRDAERAALSKDKKANPKTALAANVVGGIVSPVNKLGVLQDLSLAKQGALVGAATGAGTSEADNLAGLVTDTAVGGATGAAVGKGLDLAGKAISKGYQGGKGAALALKQRFSGSQAQEAAASAESAANAGAALEGGAIEAEQGGKLFEVKTPKSLDELRQWNPKPDAGAVPGKERLKEIVETVPDLETQPLKFHYDMMDNPKSMKALKLEFENLPTDDAKKIAAYNQQIVKESEKKIGDTVSSLAGGKDPKSLTDAGYDFISSVKDKYNAEKEALGPVFQELQKTGQRVPKSEAGDLIQAIGENSKIGKLLKQDVESGRWTLGANTPRSGLSDSEHSVLKRVIDDLNDGVTFKELQSLRDFMRKSIDPSNPSASEEVSNVRSMLLGQLESMAKKNGPNVGETFKAYAQNERARESIEKIIGGKIESLDSMFAANPDRVVQKVFSNPNYAKVVGEYVGPEKMQELAASYIQQGLKKATDPAKGFAPHIFKNWLKSNEQFLDANVSPEVRDRLSALADYGWFGRRFLDEVNPSGTAASLLEGMKPGSFMQKIKHGEIKAAVFSGVGNKVEAMTKQRQAIRGINEALGTMPEPSRFSVPKLAQEINLGSAAARGGAVGASSEVVPLIQATRAVADKGGKEDKQPAMRPLKGQEKWANDGLNKLIENETDTQEKAKLLENKGALLDSKKIKDLLIQASDLKPGSKAMNVLANAIKLHAQAAQGKA